MFPGRMWAHPKIVSEGDGHAIELEQCRLVDAHSRCGCSDGRRGGLFLSWPRNNSVPKDGQYESKYLVQFQESFLYKRLPIKRPRTLTHPVNHLRRTVGGIWYDDVLVRKVEFIHQVAELNIFLSESRIILANEQPHCGATPQSIRILLYKRPWRFLRAIGEVAPKGIGKDVCTFIAKELGAVNGSPHE